MSDSVQPHGLHRLPRAWDSPGKNTGVGCHCLLQCMKVKSESEVAQSCPTLSGPMDRSLPGSSVHGLFQARVLEWGATAFSVLKHRLLISALHPELFQKVLKVSSYSCTQFTRCRGRWQAPTASANLWLTGMLLISVLVQVKYLIKFTFYLGLTKLLRKEKRNSLTRWTLNNRILEEIYTLWRSF